MKALAVATGIVFWTLVIGIAVLAFFPGSDAGEPVAILQIEPATAPGTAAPEAEPQAEAPALPEAAGESPAPAEAPAAEAKDNNMDLPPGFAVPSEAPQPPIVEEPPSLPIAPQGQSEAPPAPAEAPDDAAPPDVDPDQQGAAPAATGMQQAAVEAPAAASPPPPPPPTIPESETGSITLPEVPVAELVEESQYGPLPKVAADGRRSIDVYARPSRYVVAKAGDPPRIAVLVTGLGLPDAAGGDVLKGLPAPISVAYGAYGRNLQEAVNRARGNGHEVLLQIPLEPNNYPRVDPGPHTLLTTLPPEENMKRLQWLMSRYTGYVGVTNHMGERFEATSASLTPVLEEVKRRGLLYVDDGSVKDSTATDIATAIGLDYSVVNVQIDPGSVARQLTELEAAAKERGAAIGVVKATPATVKQLSDWAAKLEAKGFVLVPVSAAVRSQRQS
ncbi:MAG: divergent polysaccharide deacetylase family protein [Methyloceanibacter sp.]